MMLMMVDGDGARLERGDLECRRPSKSFLGASSSMQKAIEMFRGGEWIERQEMHTESLDIQRLLFSKRRNKCEQCNAQRKMQKK